MRKAKYDLIYPALKQSSQLVFGNRNRNIQPLPQRPALFFIIGSGRNGSTLLASLLNQRSDVFLPAEQYALPEAIMRWHRKPKEAWDQYVQHMVGKFEQQNAGWKLSAENKPTLIQRLTSLPVEQQHVESLYITLYQHEAETHQHAQLGDHSPSMTEFAPHIAQELPTARFIFLVRDALDVILSYQKIEGPAHQDAPMTTQRWIDSVKIYQRLRKQYPDRVTLLRYEDLVQQKEPELARLYQFLGLPETAPAEPNQEASAQVVNPRGYAHLENINKPVFSSSIGKGKRELSEATQQQAIRKLKKYGEPMGYSW